MSDSHAHRNQPESSHTPPVDFSMRLRSHLKAAHIASFRELSQKAGVSRWQVTQLRRGQALSMRVEPLLRLSQALNLSLTVLIQQFSNLPLSDSFSPDSRSSSSDSSHTFQQATLQTLESMLIQLPTVLHAVQQNPDIPASRLVPLLRPLDKLLEEWGIVAIAPVGSEVPYDPQHHQLMDGMAQPGDRVRVRYTGYVQGDRLLYRAKVSPVQA